jgi:hypothetical protein
MASVSRIEDALADPAVSEWLKGVLLSALRRDPVDALNDALLLSELLEDRLGQIFASAENVLFNRPVPLGDTNPLDSD